MGNKPILPIFAPSLTIIIIIIRERAEVKSTDPDVYRVKCKPDGSYYRRQCYAQRKSCWCVDPETGKLSELMISIQKCSIVSYSCTAHGYAMSLALYPRQGVLIRKGVQVVKRGDWDPFTDAGII